MILSLVLVLTIVSTVAVTAFAAIAEDNTVSPRMTYISEAGLSFAPATFSCDIVGDILGYDNVTKVYIKLELQKKVDGLYTTVSQWSDQANGNYLVLSAEDSINPLKTYRVKATFTAYSGSQSETKVLYKYE